jgi:hypothetical protein
MQRQCYQSGLRRDWMIVTQENAVDLRSLGRVQLKRDGTQWRTGREVKGKLANGVGSQYPSLPRNVVYPALLTLTRTPRLPVVDWTDAPDDLNGLIRFAERQNLVSALVPSHFKRSLQPLNTRDSSRWVTYRSCHKYESVSLHGVLSTCRHLLGFSFVTSLKSDLCTALITHNTT